MLVNSLTSGMSPGETMRRFEESAGWRIVLPGDADWLPKRDWIEDVVVSQLKNEVRLVAIVARRPGHGALSRAITAMAKAGLKPIIVQPTGMALAILCRWGWKSTNIGDGFGSYRVWKPTQEWLKERAGL